MRRFFMDTEFVEDGETIMPISLALVRDDDRELYIEFDFDEDKAVAHDFVRENVLPHLAGQEQYTKEQARERIEHFLGIGKKHPAESKTKPIEIWTYFGATDWVLFYQLWGTLMDLPDGCPRFPMDLMPWYARVGYPRGVKPPKPLKVHHALADADWTKRFWEAMVKHTSHEPMVALCQQWDERYTHWLKHHFLDGGAMGLREYMEAVSPRNVMRLLGEDDS